jgi:hypothetical protein
MLTHYIVCRRDVPLGVALAMTTHAAGESASLYRDPLGRGFRGARTVVLGVKSEKDLRKVAKRLQDKDVEFTVMHEYDPPYGGQAMAIGLVPTTDWYVGQTLKNVQLFRELI